MVIPDPRTALEVTPMSFLDSHGIAKPSVICPDLERVDSKLTMKPLRQYAADSRNRFEQREESIFTTQLIQHPPVVTKVRSASAFGLRLRRPRALLAPDIGQMLIKMPNTHCRAVVRLEPEGFARWASSRPVTCSRRRAISAFSIILISDSTGVSKAKTLLWADSRRGIEGKAHTMPRLPES
jgi:hypothetical protein